MNHVVLITFALLTQWCTTTLAWSTNYNATEAYLHLTTGELISIPSDRSFSSGPDAANTLKQMAIPPILQSNPKNGVYTVSMGRLLAFGNSQPGKCGDSMQVWDYNPVEDSWGMIAESKPNNINYLDNMTAWSSADMDTVFLYGGACGKDISNRLVQFNLTTGEFNKVTNQQKSPTSLYGGSASFYSPTGFMLVGGKSTSDAWIGLDQVALWQSGNWTFQQTTNSTQIDSRTDALVLPIGKSSGVESKMVMMGGTVAGRAAQPFLAELDLTDQGNWQWSGVNVDGADNIIGAVSFYQTLIVVTQKEQDTTQDEMAKRSLTDKYNVKFYEADSWQELNKFDHPRAYTQMPWPSSASESMPALPTLTSSKVERSSTRSQPASTSSSASSSASPSPTETDSSDEDNSQGGMSKGGIAALSTALPLSFACAVGVAALLMRRASKRKTSRHLQLTPEDDDVQPPQRGNGHDRFPSNASTAAHSIDSWTEKLHWYERQNVSPLMLQKNVIFSPNHIRRVESNGADTLHEEEDDKEVEQDEAENGSTTTDNFNGRDVQVLVSSLRRSKLVVTNPDDVHVNSDNEDENDRVPPLRMHKTRRSVTK